ncbi:MAG: hypothetical protein KME45_25415 [Stenomitos rutilans HA7619-LM2]|nr:hypothetical protein [Stenomitos rutilans HA7619-LM2]
MAKRTTTDPLPDIAASAKRDLAGLKAVRQNLPKLDWSPSPAVLTGTGLS